MMTHPQEQNDGPKSGSPGFADPNGGVSPADPFDDSWFAAGERSSTLPPPLSGAPRRAQPATHIVAIGDQLADVWFR